MAEPTVIYIAGSTRSGSTLLANLVTERASAFNAGELHLYWRFRRDGRRCTCGEDLTHCPFWSEVDNELGEAMGTLSDAEVEALRSNGQYSQIRSLRLELYRAISTVADRQIIVDSSKSARDLRGLAKDGADLRIAHLVRDPRAVAHSWGRTKIEIDTGQPRSMRTKHPARALSDWYRSVGNAELARRLSRGRSMIVSYRQFCETPDRALDHLMRELGIEQDGSTAGDNRHQIAGNPIRHAALTDIRLDDQWRNEVDLPWSTKATRALALPGVALISVGARESGQQPSAPLIVIGAQKAGTATLANDIAQIRAFSFVLKDKERSGLLWSGPEQLWRWRYKRSLKGNPGQTPVDISTRYSMRSVQPVDVERLGRAFPCPPRLVYILRDPLARARSHHHHDLLLGLVHEEFDKAATESSAYIMNSCYAYQLAAWDKVIPRDHILLVDFEDFISNRIETIRQICEFAGVSPDGVDSIQPDLALNVTSQRQPLIRGVSNAVRSPFYIAIGRRVVPRNLRTRLRSTLSTPPPATPQPPSPDLEAKLRALFAEHTEILEQQFGFKASWRP